MIEAKKTLAIREDTLQNLQHWVDSDESINGVMKGWLRIIIKEYKEDVFEPVIKLLNKDQ